MPPVAAAIGPIAGAIAGAGSAVIGAAGSALGGLTALGAGAIGGVGALGAGAIGGVGSLLSPAQYGVPGGLIGPATEPLSSQIGSIASKVGPLVSGASQIYGMIKGPSDQPTGGQPTKGLTTGPQIQPANILGTLPNLVRPPAQQILTTPAPVPAPSNLSKYLPIAAVLVVGFLILKG